VRGEKEKKKRLIVKVGKEAVSSSKNPSMKTLVHS